MQIKINQILKILDQMVDWELLWLRQVIDTRLANSPVLALAERLVYESEAQRRENSAQEAGIAIAREAYETQVMPALHKLHRTQADVINWIAPIRELAPLYKSKLSHDAYVAMIERYSVKLTNAVKLNKDAYFAVPSPPGTAAEDWANSPTTHLFSDIEDAIGLIISGDDNGEGLVKVFARYNTENIDFIMPLLKQGGRPAEPDPTKFFVGVQAKKLKAQYPKLANVQLGDKLFIKLNNAHEKKELDPDGVAQHALDTLRRKKSKSGALKRYIREAIILAEELGDEKSSFFVGGDFTI